MKDTTTTSDTASRRPTPAARGGHPRRRKLTFDRVTFFLAFLGVPLAIFVTFVLIPFIQAIYWGMTDWRGFSPDYTFVGLDNFTKMFQDDIFMKALRNVALLAVFVPLVTLTLALGVAVAVTLGGPSKGPVRGIRGASFYRIVSFFPYVVPAIIVGLIWAQMYDPNAGLVNGVLTAIGLDQFDTFAWLGETASAMPALMFVIVWGLVGFYAVLFIAAIKEFPPSCTRRPGSTEPAGSGRRSRSPCRRSGTLCRRRTSTWASPPSTRSSTYRRCCRTAARTTRP